MSKRAALFILALASCHRAHSADFAVPFRPLKDSRPIESHWLPMALTDRMLVRVSGKKHIHIIVRFGA